jgi:putative transposase
VSKTYQKKTAATSSEAVAPRLEATIALTEIAESAREGLLALAVATGLQVMGAWMNADVDALCGPRGKH